MKNKKYVERITMHCLKIEKYMAGVKNIEEFCENVEKVDAILLNLEQIGESAKKLTNEFKERYKSIEWNKVIGLRNLISHEYEGIDFMLIYNVATINIPDVLIKTKQLLNTY